MTIAIDKLSSGERFGVGFIVGASQTFFDTALYAYKTRSQLRQFHLIPTKTIALTPQSLFIGWKFAVPAQAFVTAGEMWSDRKIEQLLTHHEPSNLWKTALSSCLAGALMAPPVCWIEAVLTQIQLQQAKDHSPVTTSKVIQKMYQQYGSASFSRGTLATTYRDVFYTFGYLKLPLLIKAQISTSYDTLAHIFSTLVSAIAMAVFSQPFDSIKTAMQSDMNKKKFKSFTQTGQLIYTIFGWKGLFYGLNARIGRVVFGIFYMSLFVHYGTQGVERLKQNGKPI